jgi:hypothetical protein
MTVSYELAGSHAGRPARIDHRKTQALDDFRAVGPIGHDRAFRELFDLPIGRQVDRHGPIVRRSLLGRHGRDLRLQ